MENILNKLNATLKLFQKYLPRFFLVFRIFIDLYMGSDSALVK